MFIAGGVFYPHLNSNLQADVNRPPIQRVQIKRGTLPTYAFEAGVDGEVFPAFANYASLQRPKERQIGTFTVTVKNTSDSVLSARVSVQVPGWSDIETQNVGVPAGEIRELLFAPAFLPRLFANREIAAASATLRVADGAGKVLHSESIPIRLRSTEDIYWGKQFRFAPFIASWVTPHDPRIESILSKAKEYMPGRRLPGYETWKSPEEQRVSTIAQAKAIYRAVQKSGLSYVKSSITFGRNADVSERVRMPAESISRSAANCIDGVVLYASIFENLGMDPVIVLVPGHAYVGVRDAKNSSSYLYLETAITGRSSFSKAAKAAEAGVARLEDKEIIRIDVSQAREAGIYPMPLPGHDPRHLTSSDADASTGVSER
jgi:hypothetical protein